MGISEDRSINEQSGKLKRGEKWVSHSEFPVAINSHREVQKKKREGKDGVTPVAGRKTLKVQKGVKQDTKNPSPVGFWKTKRWGGSRIVGDSRQTFEVGSEKVNELNGSEVLPNVTAHYCGVGLWGMGKRMLGWGFLPNFIKRELKAEKKRTREEGSLNQSDV